jgi:hypothetical protein
VLCSIALHLHFYVGTQSGFLHICVLANCLIGPPNSITETLKRHLPLAFCTFVVSSTLVCSLHPLQPNLCGQRVTKLFHICSNFHSWLKTKSSTHSSVGIFENTISHNEASVISNMLNNDKVAMWSFTSLHMHLWASGYPPMFSDGCAYPIDLCYAFWWWLIFANDVNVTSKTTTLSFFDIVTSIIPKMGSVLQS